MNKLFFLSLLLFVNASFAQEAFIPSDNNYVIAKWKVDVSNQSVDLEIANLLNQAKYPGNSNHYAQASILIDANLAVLSEHPQFLYYQAITQQYYHKFAQSTELLQQLLKQNPAHANARLLLSNLFAVQGEFAQAKAMCSTLVGKVEIVIVAACKLNIDAQQGDQAQIKLALDSLTLFTESYAAQNLETTIYIDEIRASMATYIKNYEFADEILSAHIGEKAPVSFWVLWADIQLALNQPSAVLNTLGFIVSETKNQDDALLLRLALAEKALNVRSEKWLPKVEERIALRELRQDEEHAFDIALYYYHVENKPKIALTWAELNWQQAKLKEDALLLSLVNSQMDPSLSKPKVKANTQ